MFSEAEKDEFANISTGVLSSVGGASAAHITAEAGKEIFPELSGEPLFDLAHLILVMAGILGGSKVASRALYGREEKA